jgi:hypothetical protein
LIVWSSFIWIEFWLFDTSANELVFEENLMAKPQLTIALSHYDRHVPFFDGTAQPDGIDLNILIVGQSDRQGTAKIAMNGCCRTLNSMWPSCRYLLI